MTLDKQLKKLSKGDESAFDFVYQNTYKTVYYIALSIIKDKQLAEDVMQSTYLKVIKNSASYEGGTNAAAWIARIARNEALNLKKKRGREVYVDEREHLTEFGSASVDDYGLLTDLARRILDEDEFTVLMLTAVEGYKLREISQILDMPISTVSFKYKRATQKMREELKD